MFYMRKLLNDKWKLFISILNYLGNSMKISVTVPCFNQKDYIGECLESILTQEVKADLEIIVGDDCSTDGTAEIINDYQLRYPLIIKAILRNKNIGAVNNFCDLIKHCTGGYIAHLDGDDLMLPGKLAKQVRFLELNSKYVAVTHNMLVFEEKENTSEWLYNSNPIKEKLTINDIVANGAGFCNSSKMYRRSGVDNLSDLVLPTTIIADWALHIMNARHGCFGYINEALGKYRRTDSSTVRVNANKVDLILTDHLKILEIASLYPEVNQAAIKKGYARVYYERAARHLDQGNISRFKSCINESYSYMRINTKQALLHYFVNFNLLLWLGPKIYWFFKRKQI